MLTLREAVRQNQLDALIAQERALTGENTMTDQKGGKEHEPLVPTCQRLQEPKVCPECQHVFQGNGWDGIDAHWKAKHQAVMPYKVAWPLIQAGTYTGAKP